MQNPLNTIYFEARLRNFVENSENFGFDAGFIAFLDTLDSKGDETCFSKGMVPGIRTPIGTDIGVQQCFSERGGVTIRQQGDEDAEGEMISDIAGVEDRLAMDESGGVKIG